MTTFNDIHNVIDDMYNARSEFRSIYLSLSGGKKYSLEEYLTRKISESVKVKVDISVDISIFNITVTFDNDKLSRENKNKIDIALDGAIRNFLESNTTKEELLKYLQNPANKIMDIYTVGESIKILM